MWRGKRCTDPSIKFFGLEWKVLLRKCRWISKELNMMLEHHGEENTVDYSQLEIMLVELGGLEDDVTSLTIAVCRENTTGMQAAPRV